MARRKSMLAQVLDDRRRAQAQRERDRLRAEKEAEAEARRFYAEQQRQVRAEERKVEARRREEQRRAIAKAKEVERQAAAKEKEAARQAAARAKESARRAAMAEKDRQRKADQRHKEAERQIEAAARRRHQEQVKAAKAAESDRQRAEAAAVRAEKERARQDVSDTARRRTDELTARRAALAAVLSTRLRLDAAAPWTLGEVFDDEGPEAFAAEVAAFLESSPLPDGVPHSASTTYLPASREIAVTRELPLQGIVPAVVEYRVSRGVVQPVPAKEASVKEEYGQLLARLVLRSLAEVFACTPPVLVDSVVLNGRVTAVDPATGKEVTPILVSVQVQREEFEDLRLDEPALDPQACLRKQNALLSDHPHQLVPVKPLFLYTLDRFKIVQGMDVVAGLDSRIDLLTLEPNEFEVLIRELFEAMGLRAWDTHQSGDEGVDAVAVNEDPITGGLVIIQAKRYKKLVSYESVTALAGVMHHKNAAKGIMVTTSWVGKSSKDFANQNGRLQIIEGRELVHLLNVHMKMDVLIGLPTLPPGWQRSDVA